MGKGVNMQVASPACETTWRKDMCWSWAKWPRPLEGTYWLIPSSPCRCSDSLLDLAPCQEGTGVELAYRKSGRKRGGPVSDGAAATEGKATGEGRARWIGVPIPFDVLRSKRCDWGLGKRNFITSVRRGRMLAGTLLRDDADQICGTPSRLGIDL